VERQQAVASGHRRISPQPPSLTEQVGELLASRDLFGLLFKRELQVRYKQTALGAIWVAIQPLVPALIFAVVFGTFARLPSSGVAYLLFALSGLVIFGLFSNAVSRAGSSFIRDGQLVTKVYFPRSILPLASGSAATVDFLVGLAVVVALMLALGVLPSGVIIVVPLMATFALAIGLGLGMAIAALSARYRDFALAVPFILQVLLYASPVVYSAELVPESWRAVYSLNPLVAIIEGFRWALLGTPAPSPGEVLTALVTGSLIVAAGILVFSRASRDLTDVI